MLTKPIIIELSKINDPETQYRDILKPKVAKAKRLTEKEKHIMEVYKRFQKNTYTDFCIFSVLN